MTEGALWDAVVVGAGISGLACAAEMTSRGLKVLVLEKDDIGYEQSGRSMAGVVLPDGKEWPADETNVLKAAADEWDRFEDRWDCRVEFNREGWITVEVDDADQEINTRDSDYWTESTYYNSFTRLDTAEGRERFPSFQGPFKAVEIRNGGHVNAQLAMQGLARAIERGGGTVLRDTLVTGFRVIGGKLDAVLSYDRTFPTGAVVVASGIWSARVADHLGLRIPMQRVRVPCAETCPIPRSDLVPGLLRTGTLTARLQGNGTLRVGGGYRKAGVYHDIGVDDLRDLKTWAPLLYEKRKDVSLRANVKMLVAQTKAVLRRTPPFLVGYEWPGDRGDSERKLRDLQRLVPALEGVKFHRRFAGVMDLTPDLEPVAGPSGTVDGAYLLTGFSGHGYMLGLGVGRAVAQQVAGESATTRIDIDKYDPQRFENGTVTMRDRMF